MDILGDNEYRVIWNPRNYFMATKICHREASDAEALGGFFLFNCFKPVFCNSFCLKYRKQVACVRLVDLPWVT